MSKEKDRYAELCDMAKDYGVEDNALFLSAAQEYAIQRKVILMIEKALTDDEPTVTKEYVRGRQNLVSHPLIQQLPKHVDSANKTLKVMLDIITGLGAKKAGGDKLGEFVG